MNTELDDTLPQHESQQPEDSFDARRAELLGRAPIPLLWLFGKTGSGKSSIVQFLTGATRAEIGNGFRPQTTFSQQYDFPDEDTPLVRFLDTRGLGEAGYDPEVDLKQFDDQAHLIIVTVRVTDQATDPIYKPLRQIRKADPRRPVLLVMTALHDAYPGKQHPQPDPFDTLPADSWQRDKLADTQRDAIRQHTSEDLLKSIEAKLTQFSGLFDRWMVVDLTRPDEGFAQPEFGGQRLKTSILQMLPDAYRQTLLRFDELNRWLIKSHNKQCAPIIVAHSLMAATAAAVPVPWIDIPVVLAIQSRLAYKLAKLNKQKLDAATLSQVSASLGGRVAAQMGIRSALKFIPWVGMAVNSAATFAITFASGWAWNWYFVEVGKGHVPTTDELRSVYSTQLKRGEELWKSTRDSN